MNLKACSSFENAYLALNEMYRGSLLPWEFAERVAQILC
jgi:hypothetical protein